MVSVGTPPEIPAETRTEISSGVPLGVYLSIFSDMILENIVFEFFQEFLQTFFFMFLRKFPQEFLIFNITRYAQAIRQRIFKIEVVGIEVYRRVYPFGFQIFLQELL